MSLCNARQGVFSPGEVRAAAQNFEFQSPPGDRNCAAGKRTSGTTRGDATRR